MPTSPRKRFEAFLLAFIAIGAVLPLRIWVESRAWFIAEFTVLLSLFVLPIVAKRVGADPKRFRLIESLAAVMIALTPIVFAILTRWFGTAIAFEVSALSSFGAIALAIAVGAKTSRTLAMSIVSSGFLILFATSISDDPRAILLAIGWMAVCVWHLVANHWEKLDLCMPDDVQRNFGVRPFSVVAAVGLCIVGGLVVHGRFRESDKLAFGFMPTSGGSKWSDPAARSGVGTGDAAIAAKNHAESFGAVDSDIFLESNESSLFDMVNDVIGEPKLRKKWETRQAIGNENVIKTHEKAAKSEQGGSSFSTDRMPPKKHAHLKDRLADAVVQWSGPTGVRLAMHRYDQFDGVVWTNASDHAERKLTRHLSADQNWFFDPAWYRKAIQGDDTVSVDQLKVLRLNSARLPAPMMTAGLHIKDVDRQDFFGIDHDGSFYMPRREKVPQLTVVSYASLGLMEDDLRQGLSEESLADDNWQTDNISGDGDSGDGDSGDGESSIMIDEVADYAKRITNDLDDSYSKLQAIVTHLRSELSFDRSAAFDVGEDTTESEGSLSASTPVSQFLRSGKGGDHLFATAAALMARQIGLKSRLVTGFYVPPGSIDFTAGHANITPEDVHVWAEIRLPDGRWFEIEPTPGFQRPVYAPSLWLITKQFVAAHWPVGLAMLAVSVLMFATRLIWMEWLLSLAWRLSRPAGGKRQIGLAMRILEIRAKMVGAPRPIGKPQRDWLESMVAGDINIRDRVGKFCDVADQAVFGSRVNVDRKQLSPVVRLLTSKHIRTAGRQVTT